MVQPIQNGVSYGLTIPDVTRKIRALVGYQEPSQMLPTIERIKNIFEEKFLGLYQDTIT